MIFYDLETTGLDLMKDRIIEIYALKINGDQTQELHHIVNPGIPIPVEVSKIHGFTDESVKDKPLLKDVIKEIAVFFENEDLAGYNIAKFDNFILDEEFIRNGCDLKLETKSVIDVFRLWQILEPRSLAGALKRFCNENGDDFHGAKFDVLVTKKVFASMQGIFNLAEKTEREVAEITTEEENSFCFGKILANGKGEKIFNFGKHSGSSIKDVYTNDRSYVNWLINESNMDSLVKYHIQKEIKFIQ